MGQASAEFCWEWLALTTLKIRGQGKKKFFFALIHKIMKPAASHVLPTVTLTTVRSEKKYSECSKLSNPHAYQNRNPLLGITTDKDSHTADVLTP